MAQTVKLKRSAVAGNVPTTSSLELGELAINTIDGRVFFEKSSSAGYQVKHIITSDSQTTGSLELTGNISSSFTSTGSVGRLETAGSSNIAGNLDVGGTLSVPGFSNLSASLASAVAGGDNLGNHTATQNINVGGYNIYNLANVTASGDISGSSTSTGSFGYIETAGAGNVALFGDSALADEYIAVRSTTNGAMFGIDASLNSGNGGVLISGGTNKSFAIKVADSSGFGAGTPEFTIDTSGNVDVASGNLDVSSGNLDVSSGILGVAKGSIGEYLRIGGDDNSNQRGLRFTSATTTYTGDTHTINAPSAGGNIVFQTNSTERLRIDNSGNVRVTGDIIAERYVVSSSVSHFTQSFSSGSTIFGDTVDDTHQFTGSLLVSSSVLTVDTVGGISGSSTSTGSFGSLVVSDKVQGNTTFGGQVYIDTSTTPQLILRNAAGAEYFQISNNDLKTPYDMHFFTNSTRAMKLMQNNDMYIYGASVEFPTANTLISGSATSTGSFGKLLGDGSSLTGVTSAEAISGSDDTSWKEGTATLFSGSSASTASFGRIEADVIEAKQFIVSSSVTNIVTIDISGSTHFGDSADDIHAFTGSVVIPSGSLKGELYVDTNANKMFIGKFQGGIPVSGSSVSASRYATGSGGSIIDLGYSIFDEDGNESLITTGDGIHVDAANYWYNNKFFKIGSSNRFIEFNPSTNLLKTQGELVPTTGSFEGELYITTGQTGSMFIGKFTGGIPVSGSVSASRYATGSDGSIVDLGYTTVDEDGNVSLITTGDGIYLDNNNYWYNNGFFKIGDSTRSLQWDNVNFNISASNVSVTGNISGSATSTGSFGKVEATTFAGDGAGLTNVPDYVFESDYDLKPLSYVETFVSQSLHLPNVPGRDDLEGWKSYDVDARDMLLLEKIEELTLYVIRLEKRIKELENNKE